MPTIRGTVALMYSFAECDCFHSGFESDQVRRSQRFALLSSSTSLTTSCIISGYVVMFY